MTLDMDEDISEKLPEPLPDRERIAPPHVEVIKRTRSICPKCFKIIDADVAADEGRVWMYKVCREHGATRGSIEKDVPFYRATMNRPPIARMPYHAIIIPVTHRCNLDCALCFVPKRDRDDLSMADVKRLVDSFPDRVIALSGGEPTLREDLPDLIRHVCKRGSFCQLFTNGIRLADRGYLHQLVDAGLERVLFSFNGFKEETYQRINGRPLLDTKLKALENCIHEKLEITISPTLFRDLNEEEVGPLIKYCLSNSPHTYELRMRGAARVGRHGSFDPLTTYEQLKLVADAVGRDVPDLISEFDPAGCYHSVIQFNMFSLFDTDAGRDRFYWWDSGFYLRESDAGARLHKLQDQLLRDMGWRMPAALIEKRFKPLIFNIWGWPDADNIDFQEIWSHGVWHLYNNRTPMNFCEAVLRAADL